MPFASVLDRLGELALLLVAGFQPGGSPAEFPLQATPAPGAVTAPGATVQRLGTGFTFTEGPAADAAGDVWFSDVRQSRIHRWQAATGTLTLEREATGGANGLFFDAAGRLLICEGGNRRMTRLEADGSLTLLMERYGTGRLNSPNDLWLAPEGDLYFSDPRYGGAGDLEQDGMHVYLIPADGRAPLRVTDDLVTPNGLIGTEDGRTLYIADAGARRIWRYRVAEDGLLTDKQLFTERGSDGMSLDERGNVYLANGNQVWVHAPDGSLLQSIVLPEAPSNLTFAGPDRRTLFITARSSVYRIAMALRGARLPVEGLAPAPTVGPQASPSPAPSATQALPEPTAGSPVPTGSPPTPAAGGRLHLPRLGGL